MAQLGTFPPILELIYSFQGHRSFIYNVMGALFPSFKAPFPESYLTKLIFSYFCNNLQIIISTKAFGTFFADLNCVDPPLYQGLCLEDE